MHWLSSNYQWVAAVVVMPILLLLMKQWVDSPKKTTNVMPTHQNFIAPVFNVRFEEVIATAKAEPANAAESQSTPRPEWPKQKGEYTAPASEAIPLFPRALSGYRSEDNKDFWNKPFPVKGSIRVFKGSDWQGIPKFPNTMNGCSAGVFMIRWRSADPDVRVQSSARYSSAVESTPPKTGVFGYMAGSNCEQPMFKFADALHRSSGATLVDVYYELKFWQAAP